MIENTALVNGHRIKYIGERNPISASRALIPTWCCVECGLENSRSGFESSSAGCSERYGRIRRELTEFANARHIALEPGDITFSEGFPLIDGMPADQWLEAMTEERPTIN